MIILCFVDEPTNRDEEFVHAPPVHMLEKENQEKVCKYKAQMVLLTLSHPEALP